MSAAPVARGETGRARSVVQVTLWDSPYLGNFMSGQLLLAEAVANELGLATHLVLAEGALSQPWRSELDRPHLSWSVLPADGRRRWIRHLEQVVREHRAAIVHSHFTHADLEALVAARRHGASCVWQMHTGFETYSVRQRLKDLVKVGLIGRRVDRVVAVSEWVATLARRRGFRASRVVLIPNAIVLDRFATLPEKTSARARFGIDATADVALALAWWPEAKGSRHGARGAPAACRARRRHGWACSSARSAWSASCKRRCPPGVPWVRLTRFVEDAATLYAAADVFVSASRHEGYSYAVGEALACGLPVVLSDIDGTRFFTRAPAAFTFPVDDRERARRAAQSRAGRIPTAPASDRRNRAWAFEHLAIGPWADRMIVLYRELL